MSALVLIAIALILFLVAYKTYGTYLAKKFDLDDSRETPAHTFNDGVDYVPAKAPVLLGHHFASIAGAAPIIGPVTAAVFGWVPAFLWIVLGGIFLGAVHDFSSIVASVRHKGKSIGAIIDSTIGDTGKRLFNIFAWLTLVLIIAAFANVVAKTFVKVPEAGTSSLLFIAIAILYGYFVYRNNFPVVLGTIIGVALLIFAIWFGVQYPLVLSFNTWVALMLIYVVIASVVPVWILLQPRDYLNSFLLYAMLGGAVIGLFFYNPKIEFVAFAGFETDLGWMFPVLFVTIACGAISGFHSLVSSGTTSKQLNKESDAKLIGYGGMLIESTLAIIALITAIMLSQGDYAASLADGGPVALFSRGVGSFLETLGFSYNVGVTFTSLVVSAFALTTLDTATRLGRYIFQELFESKDKATGTTKKNIGTNPYFATIITVLAAGSLAVGNWKAIWPIFGSANQLLAAIALLAVSVWLAKIGKKNGFVKYPMYFMFAVTLSALAQLIYKNILGGKFVLSFVAIALFILAIVLAGFARKTLKQVSNNSGVSA
ncbi:carbon starvation protein CstA [Vulcanibacillus modesticaldus]|uniref:Carbon starvation protein CstA n=1 Tax=Vulcanibacillus modesticaldus TaxID=337097 RepID=A0A1D2YV66_9BACI|nr:carbon starvation protein A [Vulcanibacillus modesticaldus]OEF99599.1 carbon starvation protein CstA [Vulcanibacillus modesticaldus]